MEHRVGRGHRRGGEGEPVVSRDPHAPADRWREIAPGVWHREAVSARSPSALVRSQGGGFVMRIGNAGPWLAAGDTLAAATEHAGGHAARLELMAERGGDDLCGACATCTRLAKEAGDGNNSGAGALREP